jgi:predicted esterase
MLCSSIVMEVRMRLAHLSLVALFAFGLPALADTPLAPVDVARALADGRLEPGAAARAWADAGLTPDEARDLLVRAGPTGEGAPGERKLDLIDRHGTKTDAIVVVPDAPRADGRYGMLIVLHGLRGNARQLLGFAQQVAPPGYIIVAPTAQFIPPDREAEDGALIGQAFGLAGAATGGDEKDDAERRRRARELMESAHRAALPHWWGYETDGFPLLAEDEVRRRWPIDPDRVVLMGYSMGGFGTWNVGLRHPDRFAAIAPLAGGISRKEFVEQRDDQARRLLGNARMVPTFFVHGSRDPVVPFRFSRTIAQELTTLGAEHRFTEVEGGGHVLMPFLSGNELTTQFATWLAARVRDPHPRKVEHHALDDAHGASWWVRVEALSAPTARVEAEVVEGNRIVVKTEGVSRLTLTLDPTLLDPTKPVRVELDGRVAHDGLVAPSLEAVAASFGDRRDPSLVHTHALTLDVTPSAAPTTAPAAEPAPAPAAPAKRYF